MPCLSRCGGAAPPPDGQDSSEQFLAAAQDIVGKLSSLGWQTSGSLEILCADQTQWEANGELWSKDSVTPLPVSTTTLAAVTSTAFNRPKVRMAQGTSVR